MVLAVASTLIYEKVLYGYLDPPAHVRTIQDFRQWNPSFRETESVTFRGSTYYAVRGPVARSYASGPSEYYFDHNGNYLGRNMDIGDYFEPAIFFSKETERRPVEIGSIPSASP